MRMQSLSLQYHDRTSIPNTIQSFNQALPRYDCGYPKVVAHASRLRRQAGEESETSHPQEEALLNTTTMTNKTTISIIVEIRENNF